MPGGGTEITIFATIVTVITYITLKLQRFSKPPSWRRVLNGTVIAEGDCRVVVTVQHPLPLPPSSISPQWYTFHVVGNRYVKESRCQKTKEP